MAEGEFGEYVVDAEVVVGEQDDAVKPEVGDFVHDVLGFAIFACHQHFACFFYDFFEDFVLPLVQQLGGVGFVWAGVFALVDGCLQLGENGLGHGRESFGDGVAGNRQPENRVGARQNLVCGFSGCL